ncbi:CCN family member 1-like [Homarus americanus]|uniref:CCN family member 1-like n=1 Tax=Homarus americanus TaxID=6706 RepID=UPI001C4939FA|nr:CCN family member 1-like [Homarus americanus]
MILRTTAKMRVTAWMMVMACSMAWGSVAGQRAPCYKCEMYKDAHPHSNPYIAIRAHCVYPCGCGGVPDCDVDVRVVIDGCGCCWQCARQLGQPCDGATLCDLALGLTCHYNSTADPTGTCQEVRPAKCTVNNRTYDHGQTFTLDCRTQCTCQNGTYACVSLCPSESILPGQQCHNPHLVTVPGQCCREWMCDRDPETHSHVVISAHQRAHSRAIPHTTESTFSRAEPTPESTPHHGPRCIIRRLL